MAILKFTTQHKFEINCIDLFKTDPNIIASGDSNGNSII